MRFLHCFHKNDEAVEISRQRRGLDYPVPGQGAVLPRLPGLAAVDCSGASATMGNHDYGRIDANCLAEGTAFLAGKRPDERPNLAASTDEPGVWVLRGAAEGKYI